MEIANNSDFIVHFLSHKGIEDCFSIVGGHSLFLNRSFHHSSINVHYLHHEQSASMAADSYYRVKLKPAVVNISAGPAALNTLNGVYGSYVDSIPVIYVSGNPKNNQNFVNSGLPLRQFGDQEYSNISELVKPIVKYSVRLTYGMDIDYELNKAFSIATGGRPGPVWIDIPMDFQNASTFKQSENHTSFLGESYRNSFLDKVGLATNNQISLVKEKFFQSKRPVLYIGANVRTYKAIDQVRQLSDQLKIPVVTAWNAHDVIPSSYHYFSGRPGLRGERVGNWVVYHSDFLLIVGDHLAPRQIGYGDLNSFSPSSFKVLVDHDSVELIKPSISIDLPIHADIPDFCTRVLDSLSSSNFTQSHNSQHLSWSNSCRQLWHDCKPLASDYASPKNPYHFLFGLFDSLDGGETIIVGNGISVVGTFQVADIKEGQLLYQNYGCASMGYDLPAAVGSLVSKSNHTIVITGDGSLQLNIQELQTIRSLPGKITIFVINNDGYHSIRQSQVNIFGRDSDLHGVSLGSGLSFPDLRKIAYAYDFPYFSIDDCSSDLTPLNKCLGEEKSICEIFVNPEQFFEPKAGSFFDEAEQKIKSGSLIDMGPSSSSLSRKSAYSTFLKSISRSENPPFV